MPAYQRRFGEFQGGEYVISTTRQSAITGLLSVGAVIGAVSSGSIASKVSKWAACDLDSGGSQTLVWIASDLHGFLPDPPDRSRHRGELRFRMAMYQY